MYWQSLPSDVNVSFLEPGYSSNATLGIWFLDYRIRRCWQALFLADLENRVGSMLRTWGWGLTLAPHVWEVLN